MGVLCEEPGPSALPEMLRARTGEVYALVERIGRGGTGTVYRAVDARLPFLREVCIKRISRRMPPEHAAGLREEARLLASVRHANVVSLLGVAEEVSGAPFLVLELVTGPDLRDMTRALAPAMDPPGALPWRLAVHVGCALLRALGAVQRALPGLVHRDITPHNVLVSTEGEVKLADFGIALTEDRASRPEPRSVRGKLGYMAPEQLRGEALDVRADLFAVGVVLFELLTGRRPVSANRTLADALGSARDGFVPLESVRPDLDSRLCLRVDRLLSRDRALRPPGPDDALRALAPFGAGELGSLRMADLARRSMRSRAQAARQGTPSRRSRKQA